MSFVIISSLFFFTNLKSTEKYNCFDKKTIYKVIDTTNIYLAFKGTKTKPGEIAKSYNISNTKVSHVGILFYQDSCWKVINVTNVKKKGNNLLIDKIEDYYNLNNDIDYVALFKVTGVNKYSILNKVKNLEDKIIEFDAQFELNNDKYYCSEFVVKQLGISTIYPIKKYINNLQHRIILNRDTLNYYPVDIFYKHPNFIKVYEKKFSN